MATVFYVREGSKAEKIASSREVSVADIINLYGPEPANSRFMEGVDSPDLRKKMGPAEFFSDDARILIKIEQNEINQDTFPDGGFYVVQEART